MFQSLRVNNQVYILHKGATPTVEIGSVTNVSAPMPKFPVPSQFGQPQEMVVDVTISVNGQNINYQKLPANAEIADFGQNGNMVIACSRDAMNAEVTAMKQKSIDILNSVEFHQSVITGCDKMLTVLNPEFAEKQRQEMEINSLKEQVGSMSKSMNELIELNRQLMEKLGSDKTVKQTKN